MVKRHSYADHPNEWITHITQIRGDQDAAFLKKAIAFYGEKKTSSLAKGLSLADILLELGLDNETLAATIIYPGIQAQEIHFDALTEYLGESGNKLLHDLLQMQSLGKLQHLENRGSHHIENIRKMLLAMVTDVRAVLVILAERLWQLREAKHSDTTLQKKLAQETRDVYAPLANRLGIWQFKWEIEDLCLRYLQPETYSKIAKWLSSRRAERQAYIERMIKLVTEVLEEGHIPSFQITGRVKHIDSIYRKMTRKNSNFEDIYDISALRVLVPEIKDCYAVLSLLQNTWQQVPQEFDDYISQPKSNGYQSIHTVVIGPDNHFVEVQIRTYQMHQTSELGIAAHWRYKEKVTQSTDYENKIALLRQIMAWQKEISAESKSEKTAKDIFADRVYVFTPTGDIIDLPKGATPLDFAYHIHSEVGHRCRGAKVNGKIVPLTYTLQIGERIEVLTGKQANPSRDWLNPNYGYLKTARARSKAQHWFRIRDNSQNIAYGRDVLDKEVKRLGFTDKLDLDALAQKLNYKTADDFLAALGSGDARLSQITHFLRPTKPINPIIAMRKETFTQANVGISGTNNLLTQIARCCKPLPGDAVIGYVTRTRGVMIHRRDCGNVSNINKINQNRLIEVDWNQKTTKTYTVHLQIHILDRAGILRDVTTTLADAKLNVLGLQTNYLQPPEATIFLTLAVDSIQQLKKAIELLRHVPNVISVKRQQ